MGLPIPAPMLLPAAIAPPMLLPRCPYLRNHGVCYVKDLRRHGGVRSSCIQFTPSKINGGSDQERPGVYSFKDRITRHGSRNSHEFILLLFLHRQLHLPSTSTCAGTCTSTHVCNKHFNKYFTYQFSPRLAVLPLRQANTKSEIVLFAWGMKCSYSIAQKGVW